MFMFSLPNLHLFCNFVSVVYTLYIYAFYLGPSQVRVKKCSASCQHYTVDDTNGVG